MKSQGILFDPPSKFSYNSNSYLRLQVFSWGDNDHGQLGNCWAPHVNTTPTVVVDLPRVSRRCARHCVYRVACGSSHSVAYMCTNAQDSVSSNGLCPPPHDWSFSGFGGTPRGLLGRLYTAKVMSWKGHRDALATRGRDLEVSDLCDAAEREGVQWRALPRQQPIRDPLGFSYLGKSSVVCS